MKIIQLQEQLSENTLLQHSEDIFQYMKNVDEVVYNVKRGREENALCLHLYKKNEKIFASGSYFIGIDWLKENEAAIQVNPKINKDFEIDYVRMLNEALCEPENYNHLNDLVTIRFEKPSIKVNQQQDNLSIFLITEYLNLLQRIVKKGLKKSFYVVEENLTNKVKGKILVGKNIRQNVLKGCVTSNFCRYQIYDIDSEENRILKKALFFCIKQLSIYKQGIDILPLEKMARFIKPYFSMVGDNVSVNSIKVYKGNPIYKEYNQAITFAQLLLRRYSYDITSIGKQEVETPPFWIDMSKLFELYIFRQLRKVFDKKEITYHVKAHYQELDYLLNPYKWDNPYVIDAKYKPYYKGNDGILKDDAREICGYARLSRIYQLLNLDEEQSLPIKCLVVYPDQDADESFVFSSEKEPDFEKINSYVRFYKVGIRLPVIGL